MGPSGNIQGGFKFMILRSMKNITRQSWDIIPKDDIVIDRVNLLGKEQPEIFIFTNIRDQLIRDDDVKITGVDGDEKEAPILRIGKKNNNIDNQKYQ